MATWGTTMGLWSNTAYLSSQVVGWASDMGLDCFRIQIPAFRIWRNYSDPPSAWSWNQLDDAIYKLVQAGIQPIHTVQQPPDNPTLDDWYKATSEPYYMPYAYDFATYAGAVAARYNGVNDVISNGTNYGKLTLYSLEIGNEGSNIHFTSPTAVPTIVGYNDSPYDMYNGIAGVTNSHKSQPARDPYYYVPVITQCVTAIKAVNSVTRIGMTSMWWVHPGGSQFAGGTRGASRSNYHNFLDYLYLQGVMADISYVNFHYYTNNIAPDVGDGQTVTMTTALSDMVEVMTSYGDSKKPIWITEWNWQVPNDCTEVEQNRRGGYVLDSLIANGRVEAVIFYTLNDQNTTDTNASSWVYNNGSAWVQRSIYSTFMSKKAAHPTLYVPPVRIISGVTASLVGSLTYYGTSMLDTGGLGTASKMVAATGGVETSKQTVFVNAHIYAEIWSQGNASLSTVDAIPAAPTGRGWIFYPGAGTFDAGNWSATAYVQAAVQGGPLHTGMTMRYFKYDASGGTFASIGSISVTVSSIAKTLYTFASTAMPSVTVAAGDGIYTDLWWSNNNLSSQTDNPTIFEGGTAGVANEMQVITAPWHTTSASTTRSITTISAAMQAVGLARSVSNVTAATIASGAATHTRTITGLTASLQISSPLTLYGTTLVSTTLSTAKQALANSSGSSSSGYDNTLGTASGYSELYPAGTATAWQALGSLPGSATTHGYLLDSTYLEGVTLLAGDWTDTLRARINGGTGDATADFFTRVYKRTSAGVYTLITTLSILGQTVTNGVSQNYTLTGTGGSVSFATGDKLYYERFANVTGSVTGTAALRVDSSSSLAQGSDNCACSTPGTSVSAVGGTKTRAITGVTASASSISHSDDFNRTVAGGLGTASDGDTYTIIGAGNGTWSCEAGAYAQLTNTTGWNWAQHGNASFSGDIDITFDWLSNYDVGPGAMVFFRGSDSANCYSAGYQNGSSKILKSTAGVNATLASATLAITISTWYSTRVQMLGTTIQVRTWVRGAAEPSDWDISAVDSGYTNGIFGLLGYAGTAARILQWDNLVVSRPTLPTARSITGITVALSVPAGPPMPLPGQVITNGVSNYVFGAHDHGQPGMSLPSPTTAMCNLTKAFGLSPMLIRCFLSSAATDANINQKINDIQRSGGVPLVCLQSPGAATFNAHVVTYLGSDCLIYEFGNEPDGSATPMPVGTLSAAWNAQIPNLRRINPQAKFLGPPTAVSYRLTFLDNCKASGVIPDGIAFHWYPCNSVSSTSACLTKVDDLYRSKIEDIRTAFKNRWPNRTFAVGCTEWNVDFANPMVGYANDEPFADNFYLKVLRSLIDGGCDFACQFALYGSSNNYNMINDQGGGTTSFYTAFKNAINVLYVAPHARSISGVTAALGGGRGYARTVSSVSSALKALGVPRSISSVSVATKAFGVPHRCYPVTASVGLVSGAPVLAVAISGMYVPVQQAGISFEQRLDDRASGSFVTDDSTGLYPVQENQQVGISDTGNSLVLYRGFVDGLDEGRLGNSSTVRRTVTLKDLRALAEKRLCQEDYTNWTTGNLTAELVRTIMAQEQIAATFAMRRDTDGASFGQGTLSGVTASDDGYLELAHAGTDISDLDTATADFAEGTLTNVTATNGTLSLTPYTALKMAGSAGNNVGVNAGNYYTYWSIWQGTVTINAGDYLEYSMWMSSSSPDLVGGIDLQCSDKWCLKDSHWPDQYGIDSHPGVHMQGWADDQWLYRKIPMPPSMVGKTIKTARIALEADKEGTYCFYARNIRYKSSNGSTRATIFDTTLQRRAKVSNIGYYNIVLKPVTVYEERGSRIAPSLLLDAAGIAGESLCSWSETLSSQSDSSSSSSSSDTRPAQVEVQTSIDSGDTWQTCTNNAPLPSVPIGMDLTGKSLLVKQILCIAGPNPELPPVLNACSVSIEAAYASSKTDVSRSYAGPEMTDGTNSYCGYQSAINTADGWQRNDVSGLKQNGWRKNWRTGQTPNTQVYGTSLQSFGPANGGLYLQCGAGTGAHVHFSDAGNFGALVVECDLCIHTAGNVGIVYRTTYWGNTNNTWAYYADISATAIEIQRGSNSSAGGASTTLWTLAASFQTDQWYHMKVVVGNDNIHHVFIDDVEYITWTDGSYTAAGGVGVRVWSGASDGQGLFNNFGVSANSALADGVRTAPSVSLASVGSVGDSHIWWGEDIPASCTLDVSTSLDNGATYTSCTNGQAIPGLNKGDSLAGVSLLVKTILTSDSVSYTATLLGISWLVTGAFSASGSRTSPPLLLSPAGTMIGSSSVTWASSVPPSGTLGVDSSLNGTSWNVINASGDPIAGLVQQGDPWLDTFDTDSSSSYTSSYYGAGAYGSWTWNAAGSVLSTTAALEANQAILQYNGAQSTYWSVECDLSAADNAGFLTQWNAASGQAYILKVRDDTATTGTPQRMGLFRRTGAGTVQVVADTAIVFARGTYHHVRMDVQAGIISVYFDGALILFYQDPTPLVGDGYACLRAGIYGVFLNVCLRPLGQDATGKNAYTRQRLSSTDPLTSPKVTDLVTCVRSPLIATGVVIPQTQDWAGKQTVAGALDEIAKASNMSWRFNESYQVVMQPRDAHMAPFVLATANGNIDAISPPKVARRSPAYRNRQIITGAVELVELPESKLGNGVDTSWSLAYPIESLVSVQVNKQSQSFGVKDTDSGRMFYYTQGEKTLSLDAAQGPPTSQIDITYIARKPYEAVAEDKAQQAILAILEGASGIYEASEDIGGLSSSAADALAPSRLTENGRLAINWSCTTLQGGLGPGQLLTVVVPEHGLLDLQFLITSVSTQIRMRGDTTLLYWYDIEATTGPSLGSWSRKLTARLLQKGLS